MLIQPSSFQGSVVSPNPNVKVGTVIDLDTTLTAGDKSIVAAAYGNDWQTKKGATGNLQTNPLADAIAISRAMGTLVGPVTAKFLAPYAGTIGSGVIQKALDSLLSSTNPQTTSSHSVNISA